MISPHTLLPRLIHHWHNGPPVKLSERDIIAIVQVVVFVISFAVSISLCGQHGFRRNATWLYLVIFSLVRIVGATLELTTIHQPQNVGLFVAALVLQSIGLSYFLIILFGFLRRTLESIEKTRRFFIQSRLLGRIIWLFILTAIILGAVGGSGSYYDGDGAYVVSTLTQAGIILTTVIFGFLVILTIIAGFNISYIEPGEKRVLLAVALSLPFLLVRVLYSVIGALSPHSVFNPVTGNVTAYLVAAFIQEVIIVAILEGIGLTFMVRPKSGVEPLSQTDSSDQNQTSQRYGSLDRDHEVRGLMGERDASNV